MSISYGIKINQLLANTAPIGLLFADWLKKKGYSVQLQKKYRDSGWLTAICKGVMYRTGSRLNAYEAIASYNKQMGGTLRVAAMSALDQPLCTNGKACSDGGCANLQNAIVDAERCVRCYLPSISHKCFLVCRDNRKSLV